MKLRPDKIEAWHKIAGAILTFAAVASLAWANLAEPRVDKKIDAKLNPFMERVDQALEYNNCLHMASMTPEQIAKTNELYKQCRLAKGMKGKP
jgi:hypothetical protein